MPRLELYEEKKDVVRNINIIATDKLQKVNYIINKLLNSTPEEQSELICTAIGLPFDLQEFIPDTRDTGWLKHKLLSYKKVYETIIEYNNRLNDRLPNDDIELSIKNIAAVTEQYSKLMDYINGGCIHEYGKINNGINELIDILSDQTNDTNIIEELCNNYLDSQITYTGLINLKDIIDSGANYLEIDYYDLSHDL